MPTASPVPQPGPRWGPWNAAVLSPSALPLPFLPWVLAPSSWKAVPLDLRTKPFSPLPCDLVTYLLLGSPPQNRNVRSPGGALPRSLPVSPESRGGEAVWARDCSEGDLFRKIKKKQKWLLDLSLF